MKKFAFSLLLLIGFIANAQKKTVVNPTDKLKTQAIQDIQQNYDAYKKTALQIWEYAELGYKEQRSSALLQQVLKENGFSIETGVAEIPTAFVATYGSGKPVIAILAEYDALPGLAQEAVPEKKEIAGKMRGMVAGIIYSEPLLLPPALKSKN